MQAQFPFQPRGNAQNPPVAQINIAVTAAQQNLAIPTPNPADTSARFIVDGAQNIAWAYGNASGLTLGNGCFMLGNTAEVFTIPGGTASISVIGAAGSTLRIVFGDGV